MSSDAEKIIETDTTAHIRTRDLKQALDLLEGLQHIMTSFNAEQRGRHEPDPLLDELRGIHRHGYNWEALRYQDGLGDGWAYVAASIEEVRTRLNESPPTTAIPHQNRATRTPLIGRSG